MKISRGYSLIEMLIVLFIFSMIALISLSFLSSSANSFFQINSKTDNLKQLIVATEVIRDDLVHASDKLARNEFGVKKQIFFISPFLIENGTLNRYVSNFLNSPYSSKPLALISDVSEIEIQKPLSSSFSSFEPENIPKLLKFNIKIGEVFFKKIFIVSNA